MQNLGIVILFFTIIYIFEARKKARIRKFLQEYDYQQTKDDSDWRLQQFYDANLQKGKY